MQTEEKLKNIDKMIARLEPDMVMLSNTVPVFEQTMALSQALSLKRLADAAEHQAISLKRIADELEAMDLKNIGNTIYQAIVGAKR